jgi:hypothetical protein
MESLQATSLAVSISQTPWLWTTINLVHLFAISMMVGTIALVDLRLLGFGSTKGLYTVFSSKVLPWTWTAFVLAAITGGLLFISKATEYFVNTTFWIKMSIMFAAGINMLIFELITARGAQEWEADAIPPSAARLAGGISLACWVLVVLFGR